MQKMTAETFTTVVSRKMAKKAKVISIQINTIKANPRKRKKKGSENILFVVFWHRIKKWKYFVVVCCFLFFFFCFIAHFWSGKYGDKSCCCCCWGTRGGKKNNNCLRNLKWHWRHWNVVGLQNLKVFFLSFLCW